MKEELCNYKTVSVDILKKYKQGDFGPTVGNVKAPQYDSPLPNPYDETYYTKKS
jgi:hypothetical protein